MHALDVRWQKPAYTLRTQWSYLFFFALFEVGSLVCGVAQSSAMLIGGRAIAGMGSSGLLNGGMTIIAGVVPLQKRPIYTGIYLGSAWYRMNFVQWQG